MKRYIVVAKLHRKEQNGESPQDGSILWHSFFEEQSYTFTEDQPISAIFERVNRLDADVVELKLFDDGSNYKIRKPQEETAF